MTENGICKAIKHNEERCHRKAIFASFCGFHCPTLTPEDDAGPNVIWRVTGTLDMAARVSGTIALIEKIVEVWDLIPFGTGPAMPSEYHYLRNRIGPILPERSGDFSPFTAGAESVDWSRAKRIHDRARELLDSVESTPEGNSNLDSELTALESEIVQLLDTMQEQVQEMLYQRLGDVPNPEEES